MPANWNRPISESIAGRSSITGYPGQSTWDNLKQMLSSYAESKTGKQEGFRFGLANLGDEVNPKMRLQFQRAGDQNPYTMDLVGYETQLGPSFGLTNWSKRSESFHAIYTPSVHLPKEDSLQGVQVRTGLDTLMDVVKATSRVPGNTPGGKLAYIHSRGWEGNEGAYASLSHTAGATEIHNTFSSMRLTFGQDVRDKNAALNTWFAGVTQSMYTHTPEDGRPIAASASMDPNFRRDFLPRAYGYTPSKENTNYLMLRHEVAYGNNALPDLYSTSPKPKADNIAQNVHGAREIVDKLDVSWEGGKAVYRYMQPGNIESGTEQGYLYSNLSWDSKPTPTNVIRNVAATSGTLSPGSMILKNQPEAGIGNARRKFMNFDMTGIDMRNITGVNLQTGLFKKTDDGWTKVEDSYENRYLEPGQSATIGLMSWKDSSGKEITKDLTLRADDRGLVIPQGSQFTLHTPAGFYEGEQFGHGGSFLANQSRQGYFGLNPNLEGYNPEAAKKFFGSMNFQNVNYDPSSTGAFALSFEYAVPVDESFKGGGGKNYGQKAMALLSGGIENQGIGNVRVANNQSVEIGGITGDIKSFTSAAVAHLGTLPRNTILDFLGESFADNEAFSSDIEKLRSVDTPLDIQSLTDTYRRSKGLEPHQFSNSQFADLLRGNLVDMAIAAPERTLDKYEFGLSVDEQGNVQKQWVDQGYLHKDQAEYIRATAHRVLRDPELAASLGVPENADEEMLDLIMNKNLVRFDPTDNPDYVKSSMYTAFAYMNIASSNPPEDEWTKAKVPYVDQEALVASLGENIASGIGMSAWQKVDPSNLPEDVQAWKSLYTFHSLEKAGKHQRGRLADSNLVTKEQQAMVIAGINSESMPEDIGALLQKHVPDYDPKKLLYMEASNLHMPTPEMISAISLTRGEGEDKELVNRLAKDYGPAFTASMDESASFTGTGTIGSRFFQEIDRVATNKGQPFKNVMSRTTPGAFGGRYGRSAAVAAHEVLVTDKRMNMMLGQMFEASGQDSSLRRSWMKSAMKQVETMGGLPGSFIREPSYGREGLAAAVKMVTPTMMRKRGVETIQDLARVDVMQRKFGDTMEQHRLGAISANLAERVGGDFDADPGLLFPIMQAMGGNVAPLGWANSKAAADFERIYQQQSKVTDTLGVLKSISSDPGDISGTEGGLRDALSTIGNFSSDFLTKGSGGQSYEEVIRKKRELTGSKGQMGTAYNLRELLAASVDILGFDKEMIPGLINEFGGPYVKALEFEEQGSVLSTALNSQYLVPNTSGKGALLGARVGDGYQTIANEGVADGTGRMTNFAGSARSMVQLTGQETQFSARAMAGMFAMNSDDAKSLMAKVDAGENIQDVLQEYTQQPGYHYEKTPIGLSQATILGNKLTGSWGNDPYQMKIGDQRVNALAEAGDQPIRYGDEILSYEQLTQQKQVAQMLSYVGAVQRGVNYDVRGAANLVEAAREHPESSALNRILRQTDAVTIAETYDPNQRSGIWDQVMNFQKRVRPSNVGSVASRDIYGKDYYADDAMQSAVWKDVFGISREGMEKLIPATKPMLAGKEFENRFGGEIVNKAASEIANLTGSAAELYGTGSEDLEKFGSMKKAAPGAFMLTGKQSPYADIVNADMAYVPDVFGFTTKEVDGKTVGNQLVIGDIKHKMGGKNMHGVLSTPAHKVQLGMYRDAIKHMAKNLSDEEWETKAGELLRSSGVEAGSQEYKDSVRMLREAALSDNDALTFLSVGTLQDDSYKLLGDKAAHMIDLSGIDTGQAVAHFDQTTYTPENILNAATALQSTMQSKGLNWSDISGGTGGMTSESMVTRLLAEQGAGPANPNARNLNRPPMKGSGIPTGPRNPSGNDGSPPNRNDNNIAGIMADNPSGGQNNAYMQALLEQLTQINENGVRTFLKGSAKTDAQIQQIVHKGLAAAQRYYSHEFLESYGFKVSPPREGQTPYEEVIKQLKAIQPEVSDEEVQAEIQRMRDDPSYGAQKLMSEIIPEAMNAAGASSRDILAARETFQTDTLDVSPDAFQGKVAEKLDQYENQTYQTAQKQVQARKQARYKEAIASGDSRAVSELGGAKAQQWLSQLSPKTAEKDITALSNLYTTAQSDDRAKAELMRLTGVESWSEMEGFMDRVQSGGGAVPLQMSGIQNQRLTSGKPLGENLEELSKHVEGVTKSFQNLSKVQEEYHEMVEQGIKTTSKEMQHKQAEVIRSEYATQLADARLEKYRAGIYKRQVDSGEISPSEVDAKQLAEYTKAQKREDSILSKMGQLDQAEKGIDAGGVVKGFRNVLGGWGMMYINRLAQMPQRLWQYGYQESEQWEEQRNQMARQSGYLGALDPSVAEKVRQAQIRAGGTMYAGIQELGTHISGGARDLAGAGMAGISAGLGTAFIMQGFSASASLFGPVAAGIGLAVAGGSAIATGISYRQNPDRTIPDVANRRVERGDRYTPGWKDMWMKGEHQEVAKDMAARIELFRQGVPIQEMAGKEYTAYQNGIQTLPQDFTLRDMLFGSQDTWFGTNLQQVKEEQIGILGEMNDEEWRIYADSLTSHDDYAAIKEPMFSLMMRSGQKHALSELEYEKGARMLEAGVDPFEAARNYASSIGMLPTAKELMGLQKQVIANGESLSSEAGKVFLQNALGYAVREDQIGRLMLPYDDLMGQGRYMENLIRKDNMDIFQDTAALDRLNQLQGFDSGDIWSIPQGLDDYLTPEERQKYQKQLSMGQRRTNLLADIRDRGFRSQEEFEDRYDFRTNEGLAAATRQQQFDAQLVDLGISNRSFYAKFDVGGDQFQAGAAQTYLGLQTHIQSSIGRDISQTVETMQGAYGNLGATYLQQMYSGNEARLTQMAQAGMFSQYDSQALGQIDPNQIFSRMDINAQGNLTGLSPLTTSLNYGNLGPAQFASQVWGEGWDNGSAWRTAGVQGLGATWNGRDVPTRLQGMQGMRAMQWVGQQMQYDFQQQMAGNQMARLALAGEYQPKFWAIEDQQRELQHETSLWGREYQWRSHEMQGRHFMDSQALNRTQTMLQRGWTMEDWGYQDQMRNMQWGWQQEDYAEDIRFMTGRQRKQAQRQMERQTTIHGMEGDQIEKQRDRQQELWGFEDERHDMTIRNFQEQRELLEENFNKQEEFYNRGKELQDEMTRLQREYWEKNHELSLAAAGAQAAFNEEMRQYQEDMAAIGQQLEDDAGKYKTLRTLEDEFLTVLTNGLEGSIEKLKELFKDIGVDSAWEETTVVPTGGGGGGGGGSEVINQIQFIVDGRVLDEQVIRSVVRGLN